VVWVSIRAVRAKRDNHLRLDPADMRDELSNNFFGLCLIHISIDVVKKAHFMNSEILCGAMQFRLTDTGNTLKPRVGALRVEPAALPVCCTNEVGFHTF
jgi:hypothetical protein